MVFSISLLRFLLLVSTVLITLFCMYNFQTVYARLNLVPFFAVAAVDCLQPAEANGASSYKEEAVQATIQRQRL